VGVAARSEAQCARLNAHEAMKTGFHHWPQSVKIDTKGQ
jgi:hypothetical protein